MSGGARAPLGPPLGPPLLSGTSSDSLVMFIDYSYRYHLNCYNLTNTLPLSAANSTFALDKTRHMLVVGSSNGLLCVRVYKADYQRHSIICVLNPTTQTYVDFDFPIPLYSGTHFGFGFDPRTLDYKFVVVNDEIENGIIIRMTRVYSLNNRSWNIIKDGSPRHSVIHCHGALIDHSLLHWIFHDSSSKKATMHCFDVSMDNWTDDLQLPRFYNDQTHENYELVSECGVLNGCLFTCFMHSDESRFDVWVMKEYGVQGSWFRLYTIERCERVIPVFSRDFDEILVRRGYELGWYNRRRDGGISNVEFHRAPLPIPFGLASCTCRVSRVEIPGGKLFEKVDGFQGEKTG